MMSVLSSANRRSYSHSSYDSTSKGNCHQPPEAIRALAVLCLILLQHQTVLSEADDDYFMPLVTCDTSKANPYVKVSGTQVRDALLMLALEKRRPRLGKATQTYAESARFGAMRRVSTYSAMLLNRAPHHCLH